MTFPTTPDHLLASPDVAIAEHLIATPNRNRLFVDCRLGDPEEEFDDFRTCHIHGAVHAQIRDVLAGPQSETSGNLPLPTLDALQHALRNWGVDERTEIVTYGRSLALAARGWWVLKWAGLRNVRVLDGGLKAWINAGGPVAQGNTPARRGPPPDALSLSQGNMPSIEVDAVARMDGTAILIDARDEAGYLAGCIPNAVNRPAPDQWTPQGKLRTKAEISQLYAEAGVTRGREIVVYCGGGVLSAFEVLTLSALGHTPYLFVGSWSEWNKCGERMARSANYLRQIVRDDLNAQPESAKA
ncbi:sulfurtransferase [Roseovarius sp. ZX-A-9]|uniref:sulfurtransferase n=1 Tax=Roseovarius sp. ZX-A-9 TaxID=3014783 RepID=UPI00232DE7B0|nr:rhodanese-like domain-containing protein [Roseovarius sp. ZX-A-9]